MRGYRGRTVPFFLLLTLSVAGCGSSDPGSIVQPDPEVEAFVGAWTALEFTVTSVDDPEISFDITDGGSFDIIVQPSGMYTAIIEFPDLVNPVVEIGQLSSVGNSITLRPQGGSAATSSYRFEDPDLLILDGPTEFDFNRDDELDAAEAHIVLERVEG